jgi:hypothetical protein
MYAYRNISGTLTYFQFLENRGTYGENGAARKTRSYGRLCDFVANILCSCEYVASYACFHLEMRAAGTHE